MRLWHEKLIPHLPRQQLLGQHRECCALRGAGWGKSHSTINYVFDHPIEWLWLYHLRVMEEMLNRGYKPDYSWLQITYRGKNTPSIVYSESSHPNIDELNTKLSSTIYPEHDKEYLEECLNNLRSKGIYINYTEKEI